MRNQNRCGADSDKKRGYRTLRFYSYSYSVIGAPCSIRAAAGHVAIIISISGYQPRPPAVFALGRWRRRRRRRRRDTSVFKRP